jgi:threonine synthase
MQDIVSGKIPEGSKIVCTLTGNGIKDPEIAMQQCTDAKPVTINADLDSVKRAILNCL